MCELDNEWKEDIRKEIISWVKVVVCAVTFALCINNFIIVNAKVPTGSMEETIMTDDRIVAFRLSYLFSEPKRFDVIVFRYPDDETKLFVKRIIGLPGETLTEVDGKIYINDSTEPLEDYFVNGIPTDNSGPYTIPEDSYFMMGDNRNNSADSRRWDNTFLKREKILGEVVFKYYPGFKILLH